MRVSQIVSTIIGEGLYVGEPCLLVRLSGCNLHCSWCDTPQARRGGREVPFARLVEQGILSSAEKILLTGGEPLGQKSTPKLIHRWLEGGKNVLVETNGTLPVERIVSKNVFLSVDVKTPSSGESGKFLHSNLKFLRSGDALKFTIADKNDFKWAKDFISRHCGTRTRATILLQPVWGRLSPRRLAQWIIDEKLPVRISVQLHKMIKME